MKVDNDLLTITTGDPFADAGGEVIQFLFKLYPDKNITDLIKFVTDVYINRFDCKLHVYFLNHPLTQAAWDKKRRFDETVKYYTSPENGYYGTCCITGKTGTVFNGTRANTFLTGSKTFVNFHNNFTAGIPLCKEILIRMYFAPLGMIQFSRYIINIRSNNSRINTYFTYRNCSENIKETAAKFYAISGVDYTGYIFNFLRDVIEKKYDSDIPSSLDIYRFTNYAAAPEIEIDAVNYSLCSFYKAVCQSEDWRRLIKFYDKEINAKSGKYLYNPIFYNLVKNRNILPLIRDYAENNEFNVNLAFKYLNVKYGN